MGIFDKLFNKPNTPLIKDTLLQNEIKPKNKTKESSSLELNKLFDNLSATYKLEPEPENIEAFELAVNSLNQFTDDKSFNKFCLAHSENQKSYISLSYNNTYMGLLWSKHDKSYRQQIKEDFNKKLSTAKWRKQKIEEFNTLLSSISLCDIQTSNEKTARLYLKDMREIKTTMITKSTILDRIADFVVLDTETTGLRPSTDRIIELSLIRFENFAPVEMLTTLINPNKPIPDEVQRINNITDEMVKNAPEIGSIATTIRDFIGKQPIVGHNIAFDLKFLYCSGIDLISTPNRKFDTFELSKKAYKNELYNHKLTTVAEHNNIVFNNQHRSSTDALATGLVFVKLCKELGN